MKEPKQTNNRREIKFRAWAKAENRMYYAEKSDKFTIDFYGGVIYNRDTWADDLVLMEYTGIRDKNGKEIYEGDIVINTGMRSDWEGKGIPSGMDIWSEPYFYKEKKVVLDIRNLGTSLPDDLEWEVIGNVWENQELIKEYKL